MVAIVRRRVGRGGGGGDYTADVNDKDDEDLNNNTTIKQCTGERGADDEGGDRQLTVGNVDDDRQQRRHALEGEDDGEDLG